MDVFNKMGETIRMMIDEGDRSTLTDLLNEKQTSASRYRSVLQVGEPHLRQHPNPRQPALVGEPHDATRSSGRASLGHLLLRRLNELVGIRNLLLQLVVELLQRGVDVFSFCS